MCPTHPAPLAGHASLTNPGTYQNLHCLIDAVPLLWLAYGLLALNHSMVFRSLVNSHLARTKHINLSKNTPNRTSMIQASSHFAQTTSNYAGRTGSKALHRPLFYSHAHCPASYGCKPGYIRNICKILHTEQNRNESRPGTAGLNPQSMSSQSFPQVSVSVRVPVLFEGAIFPLV